MAYRGAALCLALVLRNRVLQKFALTCAILLALQIPTIADEVGTPEAMPAPAKLDNITRDWALRTNATYADIVMDPDEHITDKAVKQLTLLRDAVIERNVFYVSGYTQGSYLYEKTNTEDAFPILTRFPDHASGTSNGDFFLDHAMVGVTYAPTDWLLGYAQLEYHANRFSGQKPVQLRKAYATLGNLDVMPVYFSAGRKTINFGKFDQYAPFTHTVSNHFFHAESDGPIFELGYVDDTFNLSATAISAGRHTRTADTGGTQGIDNFALSGDATYEIRPGYALNVGASYLHGTIYNHTLPHHPGPALACPVQPGQQGVPVCRGRNGAWDIWAELNSAHVDLQAEYTQTVDPWPATDQRISALTLQGRYKTELAGYKSHFSAAYSTSTIGPFSMGGPGAPVFDKLDSLTLGAEVWLSPRLTAAVEYSRNNGFAPLINVIETSRDATSNQIATGLQLTF